MRTCSSPPSTEFAIRQSTQRESATADENAVPIAMNSSTARSRLDDLPPELRNMLVNFIPLAMRAVLALLPQFRIRSDDVLRGRKLLCEWAAEHGYLELLQWAHPRNFPLLQLRDGKDACASAARGGQLAVLQWLREQKCRWGASTTCAAAEGGHLAVLQWLRANGCEWGDEVTIAAAQKGHWEVLEWALANGCELDAGAVFAGICDSGDLRIVQWALQQQQIYFVWGIESGSGLSLEVLRYLKEHRPTLVEEVVELKKLATRQLARVGDLAGLQWARENGYFDPVEVCFGAAEGGQLEVLQWVHQNGFPFTVSCDELAQGGHLGCIKWAVANGIGLTASTCAAAAQSGRLSVLQWLRDEMNCAWNGDTLVKALKGGHWEVFEWARQQGCPVDTGVFLAAIQDGFAEALQWAFDTAGDRIKLDPVLFDRAANPQVLKVLRDRGCEWNKKICVYLAQQGDLETMQWAVRNGCPWDEKACSIALNFDSFYVAQWAAENGCPMHESTRKKLARLKRAMA